VLWIIIGLVLLMVVWALVAANSGKAEVRTEPMAPTPMPSFDPPERDLPKAKHWQEATTASVSKNFGRGGEPTGISKDLGGAKTAEVKVDEEFEKLRKARPFEPRATKIDID
jgi:hypothetical protein